MQVELILVIEPSALHIHWVGMAGFCRTLDRLHASACYAQHMAMFIVPRTVAPRPGVIQCYLAILSRTSITGFSRPMIRLLIYSGIYFPSIQYNVVAPHVAIELEKAGISPCITRGLSDSCFRDTSHVS